MIKNAGETKYFISSSAHGRDNHRLFHSKDHPRTDNYENACLKVNTYIDAPFVSYDRTDAAKKKSTFFFYFWTRCELVVRR